MMNVTEEVPSRTGQLIIGIIAYSIIILLSIIGNTIVVIAISRIQRLRYATNYILMSLAIADLLVTTTVMIPGFIYEITGRWILGRVFCKIWLANDITFCTASILHLVAVSVDRFVAIENPLKYNQTMTKRRIHILIGCIWLISVLLSYGPVLFGLYNRSRVTADAQSDSNECSMRPNIIYSIISSSTSFYIPLIIILFLYGRIFITARRHTRDLRKFEEIVRRLHQNEHFVFEKSKWNKNLKAIRTLGIVVGVFIACWFPFFFMYVLLAACNYSCVNQNVEKYITWIGYANSFCNPVIYAFSNKEFRNGFFEILSYHNCRCLPSFQSHKARTSISKQMDSKVTRDTPPNQNLKLAAAPQVEQVRNEQATNSCRHEEEVHLELSDSANQQETSEIFDELERLVPYIDAQLASILELRAFLENEDDGQIIWEISEIS